VLDQTGLMQSPLTLLHYSVASISTYSTVLEEPKVDKK